MCIHAGYRTSTHYNVDGETKVLYCSNDIRKYIMYFFKVNKIIY